MNYYLTPKAIAEALNLTAIRKSTPDGMYLLSESDLVPYGIERAKQEGAIELSNNRTRPSQQQPAETTVDTTAETTAEESETATEEETSTEETSEEVAEETTEDTSEETTEETSEETTEETSEETTEENNNEQTEEE